MKDPFARLAGAAHSGAFGLGSNAQPTPAQIRAGNYAKGSLRLHGLPITIETPMYQPRRGKEDGVPWEITCMAHYGYVNGVVGADGDNLDVFVGPTPESQLVVVVNQVKKDRAFDEHKVVLGFHDLDSALLAYMNSYMKGWQGLGSYVACSITQFKAWIKSGDLSKPLAASDLITDEGYPMNDVLVSWDAQSQPVGQSLTDLMYALRGTDADQLLLDSATMADVEELLGDDGVMLDAMVIPFNLFERKANQLQKVMAAAGQTVKPVTVEVSKPFKNRGTTQVAMLFGMDDGQSVAVFFHNPDSAPNKLAAGDELISWKWVLNKKDITVTVAPENGQDLNPRQVARRIMTLVEKNSAKFVKQSAVSAEKGAELESLKGEVESKTNELQSLETTIADLKAKIAQKPQEAAGATQATEPGVGLGEAAFEGYVKRAADSVAALNVSDVYQVITSAPASEQAALGAYLAANNPKLAAEVQDVLDDLQAEPKAAPEVKQPVAPAQQPDMLGDDPALRDNRTDLEKLTAALLAGNVMGALGVLDAIEDPDALREVVLKAGFSLGASGTKDEILASVGKDLVRAAKAKVDGFGLRDLDKPGSEPDKGVGSVGDGRVEVADTTHLNQGAIVRVTDGTEYSVWNTRGPLVEVVPIIDGQAVVNADSTIRFHVDPASASEYPERRSDPLYETGKVLAGSAAERLSQAAAEAIAAAKVEPAAEEDTGTIAPEGRENTVKTAKGTKVVTGFKVIEAKNLVISHSADGTPNPDYPSELQPRDRARATSQAWVAKTARSLDPDSLGRTNRADSGAPIVGPDRVVESGNGRAMAIREAYRIGQADEYRAWLIENADYFKVSVARIEAMKAPVLVRVRTSEVNRAEFAVEANQDDKLAMTATEKARSDAKRLDTAMLTKLADGDLTAGANRDFIAAFLQSLGDAESAQYLTTDGRPTASLISRIQAALFAGAYSDDRLLELTADVSKPEIANIVSALNAAAPDFMRAKEQDVVGGEQAGERVTDSVELSLNQTAVDSIINATNMLRQAKDAGLGIDEFLRQGDMFGDIDPSVAAMAVFISANNRSAKRLGTAFKAMAQFVETENARKQTAGLFGDAPASFADIVRAANAKLEQEYGEGLFAINQDDLFSQPAAKPAPTVEDDKDTAVQQAKDYLDKIIDGTADLGSHDDVIKELESIYAKFGEGELSDLFNQAAEAFSQYALKKTAEAF